MSSSSASTTSRSNQSEKTNAGLTSSAERNRHTLVEHVANERLSGPTRHTIENSHPSFGERDTPSADASSSVKKVVRENSGRLRYNTADSKQAATPEKVKAVAEGESRPRFVTSPNKNTPSSPSIPSATIPADETPKARQPTERTRIMISRSRTGVQRNSSVPTLDARSSSDPTSRSIEGDNRPKSKNFEKGRVEEGSDSSGQTTQSPSTSPSGSGVTTLSKILNQRSSSEPEMNYRDSLHLPDNLPQLPQLPGERSTLIDSRNSDRETVPEILGDDGEGLSSSPRNIPADSGNNVSLMSDLHKNINAPIRKRVKPASSDGGSTEAKWENLGSGVDLLYEDVDPSTNSLLFQKYLL